MAKLPFLAHDLAHLEAMKREAHELGARCAVTGASLLALRKVGDALSVDRVENSLGYVAGNTRLIAMSLNTAKGADKHIPKRAIRLLIGRLEGVVFDKLSVMPKV